MTTWHADDEQLASYAALTADDVSSSSVEAHLLSCPTCRERLGAHVPPSRLAANWDAVVAALDAPAAGWVERLLVRAGVRPHIARLLAATPTLRLSWLGSILVAVSFGFLAAVRPSSGALLLVLVAPLIPVAGVSIAFSRSLDPSAEIADATPRGGLPLLFLRTIASIGPSLVVAAVAGVLAPTGGSWWLWLLPALALAGVSLLLAVVMPVGVAATTLSVLWVGAVVVTEAAARGAFRALRSGGPPESALVQAPGQAVAATVAVLCVLALSALNRRAITAGRLL